MNRPVVKGSTDVSVIVRVMDSTDGTPETGVAYNTPGADLWYRRDGGAKVSITEATLAAVDSAHSDGGFIHIGDGYCRLDLPDAAIASGANGVAVGGTFTGMVVIGCYLPLVDVNPYDGVRGGMTALPNAAAEAAGGLYTRGTGAGQIEQPANGQINVNVHRWLTGTPNALQSGRVDSYLGALADGVLTAAKFAAGAFDAVWSVATRILTAPTNLTVDDAKAPSSTHYTTTRAGYLDKLNVSGLIASAADVAAITQAQRVRIVAPAALERPEAGSLAYRLWIYAYNEQHQAEDLDANPTVTAENNAGTDRSTNLSAVVKPGGTIGVYYVDYTVASGHAIEGLVVKVTATENGTATQYADALLVVDTTAVDFTSADRAKLDELHDNRLTSARAAKLDNLDAAVTSRLAAGAYTAPDNSSAASAAADAATLILRLTSARAALLDNLASVDAAVSSRLATAGYTPPDNAGVSAAAAAAAAIEALLVELTEDDGAGNNRYTVKALEQAPAGGGGGGMTTSTALPASPAAGTVGEALAAALHVARGRKEVIQVAGTWKLRVYRYDDANTVWREFTVDHPTAPSTVTP